MEASKSQIAALIVASAAFAGYLLLRKKPRSRITSTSMIINPNTNNMITNPNLPRGYRNNNPCNIRIGSSPWLGKVLPNTDGIFEQFESLEYGYRAALALLRGKGYIGQGLNTIRKIITKFAPDNENDTQGYIAFVSRNTGINPDQPISKYDKDKLIKIVYAMSLVENNTNKAAWIAEVRKAGLPNIELVKAGWNLL
ncbi:MAG: hypothetical protein J6Q19_04830 [Bacteroidaceae bacterium]|nr:hypothetical protein [Bacteroidaceae bacterium]